MCGWHNVVIGNDLVLHRTHVFLEIKPGLYQLIEMSVVFGSDDITQLY